jgi:GR25 family glycosyltransferase involved in LPS biosynthesis
MNTNPFGDTKIKILYINLDKSVDRRIHMESQAKKFNLDLERFSAIGDDFENYCEELGIPKNLLKGEIGCTLSHLHLLKQHRGQDLLVLEDDIDLSTAEFWPFTFQEFIDRLPSDWEVVQLYKFPRPWPATLRRKSWETHDKEWSTGAYLIKAEMIEKLINRYFVGNKVSFKALYDYYNRPIADIMLYYKDVSYTATLFTVIPSVSTIQGTHSETGPDPVQEAWSKQRYSLDFIIPPKA